MEKNLTKVLMLISFTFFSSGLMAPELCWSMRITLAVKVQIISKKKRWISPRIKIDR